MGSSYIAEKNPQPAAGQGQVVFSSEGFAEQWQKSIQPLVILIKEKDLPTLNLRVGTSQKQLLSFDTFVLVTNQ